jgi:L-alanine-DL-glutamate epimerase-like enolase superfamily enzyme
MTDVDFQGLIAEPFAPDRDGFVRLPDKPGLGIELGDRWKRTG